LPFWCVWQATGYFSFYVKLFIFYQNFHNFYGLNSFCKVQGYKKCTKVMNLHK
jgi:hypothetical protein